MTTWPIRWGFGGISWSRGYTGLPSLYIAFRFGAPNGRRAIGFIIRWLPKRVTRISGLRIGRILIVKYR